MRNDSRSGYSMKQFPNHSMQISICPPALSDTLSREHEFAGNIILSPEKETQPSDMRVALGNVEVHYRVRHENQERTCPGT